MPSLLGKKIRSLTQYICTPARECSLGSSSVPAHKPCFEPSVALRSCSSYRTPMPGPVSDQMFDDGYSQGHKTSASVSSRSCCCLPVRGKPAHPVCDTSTHRRYQNYAAWSAELHHLSPHSLSCEQHSVHIHVMHLKGVMPGLSASFCYSD